MGKVVSVLFFMLPIRLQNFIRLIVELHCRVVDVSMHSSNGLFKCPLKELAGWEKGL